MNPKSLIVPGIALAAVAAFFLAGNSDSKAPVRLPSDTDEHRDRNGIWWRFVLEPSQWAAAVADKAAPSHYLTVLYGMSQEELRAKIDQWAVAHAPGKVGV